MNSPNSLSPSTVNAYLDGAFAALKRAARKVAATSEKVTNSVCQIDD